MRALAVRWVAYVIGAGSIALIIAAIVWAYVDRHGPLPAGSESWNVSFVFGDAVNIAVPLVGLILASRRPANGIGWLFLAAGAAIGLSDFCTAYGVQALSAAPGSLPAGRLAMWLSNWIWVISFAALAFLFLLFPTGQLRSPRWRPVAWFVGGGYAVTVEAEGIGRSSQDAEAAVYFCCLEALQNVSKYANATGPASPCKPAAAR